LQSTKVDREVTQQLSFTAPLKSHIRDVEVDVDGLVIIISFNQQTLACADAISTHFQMKQGRPQIRVVLTISPVQTKIVENRGRQRATTAEMKKPPLKSRPEAHHTGKATTVLTLCQSSSL
jgi:hypothetical protein